MSTQHIHIVGGGIIGLCSAWYLSEQGISVTVIDRNNFTDGTSYGNAGMIVPSHFVPMAAPGVINQGIKWLLDSKSPFYVKPRLNVELIAWLWKFYKSANQAHVDRSMPALLRLNQSSKELYKEIASQKVFDFGYEERGLLMLYKTQKQAEEEETLAHLATKLGIQAEIVQGKALQQLDPAMDFDVLGGLYFPGDAHLHPNVLMQQMQKILQNKGVLFLENTTVIDFKMQGSSISAIITQDAQTIPVDQIVISSGSWSTQLLKKLGIKLLLQDGKGYSITLENPITKPKIPTILSEAKVAITPMGNQLRVGGTLELSGLSSKINTNRVQGIIESVSEYYKNLNITLTHKSPIWKGYRPCTPDGMPYIGQHPSIKNLTLATGHGMMGLSLGAATGKLVSELLTDQQPFMDISLFAPERFGSN